MALTPTPVAGGGLLPTDYYFALKNDPGLNQTLSLAGNTVSISGGNSINLADSLTVSTSARKLTAQSYVPGFNTTNFTGEVRSEGSVISTPPLGNGSAALNGGLAEVLIGATIGNPTVHFQKAPFADAKIDYTGSNISFDKPIAVSTIVSNDVLTLNASSILCSVSPIVQNSTVSQSNQLIPKSYLDNLINIALPAIAGYAPSTISNLNKNVGKTNANLTQATGDGNIYFLYPFIDTTVSKVITYTGTANPLSTNTATAGMSLIEYPNLLASTGTVVATVGNVAGAPFNCWKTVNTRYVIPFSTPVTSYTLKAGYKYGLATIHNNSTTVTLMGFGMANALYSLGFSPYDIQTSGTFTNAGVIPNISSSVTYNPTGSGFVVNVQMEP